MAGPVNVFVFISLVNIPFYNFF